jgi:quercetin dioxygenase-like cupin family protein
MTKPRTVAEGAVFDLAVIDCELRTEDAYDRDRHTARTLVREPAMRVVLVVMKAGATIAQHRSHDTALIHALAGHLRLCLPDRTVDLPAGQLLVIPPDLAHDVEAVVESRFLITLARKQA